MLLKLAMTYTFFIFREPLTIESYLLSTFPWTIWLQFLAVTEPGLWWGGNMFSWINLSFRSWECRSEYNVSCSSFALWRVELPGGQQLHVIQTVIRVIFSNFKFSSLEKLYVKVCFMITQRMTCVIPCSSMTVQLIYIFLMVCSLLLFFF